MLRWSYVVPRALIVGLAWVLLTYGLDPLLRYGAITAGDSAVGAKVDVANLTTRFFPPELRLTGVQVADPGQTSDNLFEFGELRVRLEGEPLLYKEYVIEEATLEGLRVNADRLNDGRLDESDDATDGGLNLGPLQDQLELIGLRWYDELSAVAKRELDPQQLETVQVAASVEDEWKRRLETMNARLENLQQRVDEMQGVTKARGKALERLAVYTKASDDLKSLLTDSQRLRDEILQMPELARRDVGRLDEARRNDTERLKQRAQSLPLDGEAISKSLLGPQLHKRLQDLSGWLGWTKRYLAAGKAAAPELPASRGEWIEFPREGRHPKFVLRSLTLAGEARHQGQPFVIAGRVREASSDPQLHGQPTRWEFTMAGPDPLSITGVSDLTRATAVHEVTFDWRAARPVEMTVGEEDRLGVRLAAASVTCDGWLRLEGEQLTCKLRLKQQPLAVSLTETSEAFAQRWVAPALRTIQESDAVLFVTGTLENPEWRIESDLGPQIANGFQQVLASEIDATRAALIQKADGVARETMDILPSFADRQARALMADLTDSESRAKQLTTRLTGGRLTGGKLGGKLDLGRLLRR